MKNALLLMAIALGMSAITANAQDQRYSQEQRYTTGVSRQNNVQSPNNAKSKFNRPNGYLGLVEVGSALWIYDKDVSQSVTMVNGYRFFPQFAVGVGTGFETWSDGGDVALPLFFHVRSDFIRMKVSPFAAVNFGTYLPVNGDYDRGFFEFQGGVSFNVASKHRMTAGLGLSFGGNNDSNHHNGYDDDHDEYHGFMILSDFAMKIKVGFSF
jgi:hypothetical protein